MKNEILFTGRWLDNTTGLYYYRARWYDAEDGRFVSRDPLQVEGGDINLYRYVKNSTVKNNDPMGLASDCPFCVQLRIAINKLIEEIKFINGLIFKLASIFNKYFSNSEKLEAAIKSGETALIIITMIEAGKIIHKAAKGAISKAKEEMIELGAKVGIKIYAPKISENLSETDFGSGPEAYYNAANYIYNQIINLKNALNRLNEMLKLTSDLYKRCCE